MTRAVIFDVGGVLLAPDLALIEAALLAGGIEHSRGDPTEAHYHGIHFVDDPTSFDFWPAYAIGYLATLGVDDERMSEALAALEPLWGLPAITTWSFVLPSAAATLLELARLRVPCAIVSNADGTIEASLRAQGLCQVGAGPHPSMRAIVDSAVVGWSKPDPRIFGPALEALRLDAHEALYVGDSERIDVKGALAAGIEPLHLDPYSLCRDQTGHRHLRAIDELLSLVG